MTSTSRLFDSSGRFWLIFLSVVVLAGAAIVFYSFFPNNPSPPGLPAAPPSTVNAVSTPPPVDQDPPYVSFPESSSPQPITPEAKAAQYKEMVNQQADILRELHTKYPKS